MLKIRKQIELLHGVIKYVCTALTNEMEFGFNVCIYKAGPLCQVSDF